MTAHLPTPAAAAPGDGSGANARGASCPPERGWDRPEIVTEYAGRRYITPAEVRVLAECWRNVKGGRVLDLGVGAGRTVPYLAPVAAEYVAADLAPNMVAQARLRHPGVRVVQADARNLPFADAAFSFVLFSFCGIDYVDPDDRSVVLSEARRVLAPGGVLAYSTHNLASLTDGPPRLFPRSTSNRVSPARAAVRWARGLASAIRSLRNYRSLRVHERRGEGVAFVVDGAHEHSLVTCYVAREYEERALRHAGFELRHVIEPDARDARTGSNARDLYFVAVRR